MKGLGDYLIAGCYRYPALLPPMRWKDAENPGTVRQVELQNGTLSWTPVENMRYVVYAVPEDVELLDALAENGRNFDPQYIIGITYGSSMELVAEKKKNHWYAVALYDRFGNEWDAAVLDPAKK